jgi:hypothetical protein
MNRRADAFDRWESRQREIDSTLRSEIRRNMLRDAMRVFGGLCVLCFVLFCMWAMLLGCGGQAPTEAQPFGWCCGDLCGLTGADADALIETSCGCDGVVRPTDDSKMGDCVDDGRQR